MFVDVDSVLKKLHVWVHRNPMYTLKKTLKTAKNGGKNFFKWPPAATGLIGVPTTVKKANPPTRTPA